MWPEVTETELGKYGLPLFRNWKQVATSLLQLPSTESQLHSSKNEEVQVSFIQGWKMYHTTLLQKVIGTKHFAAGEKAIKSCFFKICYYKLLLQYFANTEFQIASFYLLKIAHSTRNSWR